MKLSVFVDDSQLGDRGHIRVGDLVVVHLVGIPIEETLLLLPTVGRSVSVTGILECRSQGIVKQVLREPLHHQALVDCGVPIVLSHRAPTPLYVGDAKGRIWSELGDTHLGRSLGGLALVRGDIAFVHPSLIQAEVRAQVKALKRIDISGVHDEELDEFEYRRDKVAGMVGLVLRVEIPGVGDSVDASS